MSDARHAPVPQPAAASDNGDGRVDVIAVCVILALLATGLLLAVSGFDGF